MDLERRQPNGDNGPGRNQGFFPTVGRILDGYGVQRLRKEHPTKQNIGLINLTSPDGTFHAHVNITRAQGVSILGNTITISWIDKRRKKAGELTQWLDNERVKETGCVLSKINAELIKKWEDRGGAEMLRPLQERGAQPITSTETNNLAVQLGSAHPNPEMTEKATLYHEKGGRRV